MTRPDDAEAFEELYGVKPYPAVLLGCTGGVCARTEVFKAKPRLRKIPEGLTPEQFAALKGGAYWEEIAVA